MNPCRCSAGSPTGRGASILERWPGQGGRLAGVLRRLEWGQPWPRMQGRHMIRPHTAPLEAPSRLPTLPPTQQLREPSLGRERGNVTRRGLGRGEGRHLVRCILKCAHSCSHSPHTSDGNSSSTVCAFCFDDFTWSHSEGMVWGAGNMFICFYVCVLASSGLWAGAPSLSGHPSMPSGRDYAKDRTASHHGALCACTAPLPGEAPDTLLSLGERSKR